MANIKFTNFARSTLSVGAASGAVSLTLASGTGSRFPALGAGEYFYLTLENASLVREIVKVTARVGDVLTVVRAQDNTTAQAWNAGDTASLRLNARAIEEAITGTLLSANNLSDVADVATARANLGAEPADADIAKVDAAQTWLATQRTNETTDNDGSFDLNAALDFKCTPTGAVTLTFTNIPATPAVQKGTIIFVNGGNYTVSAHANTKVGSSLLAALSATGTYQLSYRTSNGVVYVTASGALA